MDRKTIFDYIQSKAPEGIQFVDPYLSDVPLPKTDFTTMNIMPVEDVGISQTRTSAYDESTKTVNIEYAQERIYTVQFDCYGRTAFETSLLLKSTLKEYFLNNTDTLFNLKTVTDVENNTDLIDNKKYLERFTFRMSFYVIDVLVEKNQPSLENAILNMVDIAQ